MWEGAIIQGLIIGLMAWVAVALGAYFSIASRLTRVETQIAFLVDEKKKEIEVFEKLRCQPDD